MGDMEPALSEHDVRVLRELGEWWAGEAASARNAEKVRAWYAHDAWADDRRVMVLAEVDYLEGRRRAVNVADLLCADGWARGLEYRMRIARHKIAVIQDDATLAPFISYPSHVQFGDFGVPGGVHRDPNAHALAFNYQAPLKELDPAELGRLRHRQFVWKRDAECRERDRLAAVFEGILPVRRRCNPWQLSMPLTSTALGLVGLDQFMILMYDNPAGLHARMEFLCADMIALTRFLEDNALFDLDNEADYVGAGSMGFTRALPAQGAVPGKVRALDRWFHSESQESVGLSPEQYGTFVFPYLQRVAAQFGRVYYGCCEPAHALTEYLAVLPNLARVSVSPWADEPQMGRFCRAHRVVYSRKPSPNLLSGDRFDRGQLRAHLAKTVDCAQGCSLEIIQRDVYVTSDQPERFIQWVECAREAGARHRH
jgi:hypothetical protein